MTSLKSVKQSVVATKARTEEKITLQITEERVVGSGSFGIVALGTLQNGEQVAIKKVLQDQRYRNRELPIMRMLSHPNIVELKYFFFTPGKKKEELYLNLILEYVPDTIYKVITHHNKVKKTIPMIYVKLYTYQLFRALAYMHAKFICHRDIKPQNLLVNVATGVLKLCDFGSAKQLIKGEANVSYICSRYYRAPELVFGSVHYTCAIDVWSVGAVMGEMIIGEPLFCGDSGIDQLVEIIKILGTPNRRQIQALNADYSEYRFPEVQPVSWNTALKGRSTVEANSLMAKMCEYMPNQRITAASAVSHPFFDELHRPDTKLPSGQSLPALLNEV